ncbi:MAG: hypothetical protein ACE5I1_02220 [bacterium]
MWLILKAELVYTRIGMVIGYAIAFLLFFAAANVRDGAVDVFMVNTAVIYFITIGIIGSEADKEKRTRLQSLLPISPQRLGMVEQFYIAIFLLAGLIYLGTLERILNFLLGAYRSFAGGLFLFMLCLCMAFLSTGAFMRRKSYLE